MLNNYNTQQVHELEEELQNKKFWYYRSIKYNMRRTCLEIERIFYKNGKIKHIVLKRCDLTGNLFKDLITTTITLKKDGTWREKNSSCPFIYIEGFPEEFIEEFMDNIENTPRILRYNPDI